LHKFVVVVIFVCFLFLSPVLAHAQVYQQGDKGSAIIAIQQKLSTFGFYEGDCDGTYGIKTVQAVRLFQKNRNLPADGIVGEETFASLMEQATEISRNNSRPDVKKIINYGMKFIGVPYVFGGSSPSGFDCSGYVQYVFIHNGIPLPRTADIQYTKGNWVAKDKLQPGDLVYFTTYAPGASHVGIYLGDGNFLNAQSSKGVAIASLNNSYWSNRYFGAKRILS